MNQDQSEGEYMEQFGHDIEPIRETKQKKATTMPEQPDHMFNQAFEMASDEEIANYIKRGQPTPTHRCKIAGIPHRKPDLSLLKIDDLVNLVAEPHNAYDPNAIKVVHNGVHLGYIPKTETHLVQGVPQMKVVRIAPEDKWNEVHIETLS